MRRVATALHGWPAQQKIEFNAPEYLKSFLASALAQKACRDGYTVFYTRAVALFRDLAPVCGMCWPGSDGSTCWSLMTGRWLREDRYQLPVARWHEQIGAPTPADGILGRLVHNAHRQLQNSPGQT